MDDLVTRLHEAIDAAEVRARDWAEDLSDHFSINEAGKELLRRCAADRKILALHRSWDDVYPDFADPDHPERGCVGCGFDGHEERVTEDINRCPIVLALAEGYDIRTEGPRHS